jgi:hypothetical protein
MPVKTNRVEKTTFKFEVRANLKITSSKLEAELFMILILAETIKSKRKNHTFRQDEDNTWGGEVRGIRRLQEHRGGHQHSEQHDRRQSNGAGADWPTLYMRPPQPLSKHSKHTNKQNLASFSARTMPLKRY